MMILTLFVAACDTSPIGGESGADTADTGAPDTADSGDTAEDSGDSAGDSGDTADTAETDWCTASLVQFEGVDGVVEDVTATFLSGAYLTLDSPGTLHVCPGTWYSRVLIRAAVAVEGHGATPAETVMSGGESGTILDVLGPVGTLEVRNVTLDRGVGLDVDHNSGGGGIYCEGEGTVLAEGVVFSNNFANDGPGLYVRYCETTVNRSEFVDNVAEDDGGAVTIWYANASFDEVTFTGNTALDGGALCVFYGSATVTNSVIEDNESAHFAGGVWTNESVLTMSDTRIANNRNTVDNGGGILLAGEGTLERVSFEDNEAPRGGGLFVYYESIVTCTSCSFARNVAEDVYVADYSAEGGVSMTGSDDWSFSCASNVCTTTE